MAFSSTQPNPNTPLQPIPWWREYWWILGLIGVAVLLVLAFLIQLFVAARYPVNQENTWNAITPGYTTLFQVESRLGQPISKTRTAEGTKVTYTSPFKAIPHEVIADQQNKVVFIRELLPADSTLTLEEVKAEFGEPDMSLFHTTIAIGQQAHVFLAKGVVTVANLSDGRIEEKWYFEPTTADAFMKSWGKDLSEDGAGPEEFPAPPEAQQ